MRCAVYGCNNNNKKSKNNSCNTKDEGVKYFRFPKDKNICRQWAVACGRDEKFIVQNNRICSIHFCEEDFGLKHKLKLSSVKSRILKKCAIPKLCLPKRDMEVTSRTAGAEKQIFRKFVNETLKRQLNGNSNSREEVKMQSTEEIPETSLASTDEENISSEISEIQENKDESEKMKMLEEELKMQRASNRQLETALSKIFTPAQMHKLENPKKRLKWSVDDIADCIAIYSSGPRAYRLLLKKHYPLAAVSTLKAWSKKIKIDPITPSSIFGF